MSATFHDLHGVSVFISGGGAGIGADLTDAFMAQGAKVAFIQRSDASDFCDAMEKKHGMRPHFQACDITDIDALKGAIASAADAHGDIGVLVNNAANDTRHTLEEYGPAEWDASMAVNLRHHFFAAQAVVAGMRKRGAGSIINYSSISYMMGLGEYASYVSAKAGITGLTRGLARELGGDNIRVNAVMPGWILTERQRDLWVTPEKLAGHLERQCLKRELVGNDMVAPTLFLASETSAAMTGQALVVDGGVVVSG